jgi:hypothetical protein
MPITEGEKVAAMSVFDQHTSNSALPFACGGSSTEGVSTAAASSPMHSGTERAKQFSGGSGA